MAKKRAKKTLGAFEGVAQVEKKGAAGEIPAVSPILKALVDNPDTVKGMFVGKAIEERLVGVPSPSLALSWCMDNTVLPLGKMIGIAGPSQSQKTSLALEFAKIGLRLNGYCYLVDNEAAKYSPTLQRSILKIEPESQKLVLARSDSVEESQERMTSFVRAFYAHKNMEEIWTLILDSLSGTETAGEMAAIDKEGSAGRSHPLIALSWTRYLRWLTARINVFPILFISINHLKDKPPPPGQMFGGKSTPGGVAQRFHAMTYFWVKRLHLSGDSSSRRTWDFPSIEGNKIDSGTQSLPMELRRIVIECEKNSQGVDGRQIVVDFCFYMGLDGERKAFFDWDGATALMLVDRQNDPGLIVEEGENRYGKLSDLLAISCDRGRYTCRDLGLKNVSAQVLGFAVHCAPELVNKLVKFFGIKEGISWGGRMPDPPTTRLLEYTPPAGGEVDM